MTVPRTSKPLRLDQRALRRLHLLGRLHGLQLRYWDVFGNRCCPSPEAIIAVLRALGAEIDDPDDVEGAIEARRRARWLRRVDPVCVSRGGSGTLRLRLPARDAEARLAGEILVENGASCAWEVPLDRLQPLSSGSVDGTSFVVKHAPLPARLPTGYHRCRLQIGSWRGETLIVAAPKAALSPHDLERPAGWGAFLPLYALRTGEDWGVGSYRDLAALAGAVAARGGSTVSTLPLLPIIPSDESGSSPYSPVSRLFWSELFLDLIDVPEVRHSASWQRYVESPEARVRLQQLREADLVAYGEIGRLKRRLLIDAADAFSAVDGERRARFERFLARQPEVDIYARFRAAAHRHGMPWDRWPAAQRDGELRRADVDRSIYRSHLFGQWLAHEQLEAAADAMGTEGVGLYLDMPLGVPRESFDVWRHRDRFATAASAGAPPDTFFRQGQNWALPPLHPERSREHGHDYLRACVRHHLRVAGTLRIDHVMALHRLFWVPEGFPPTDGVYVRYPARELWAILALESHRNRAVIVGEDLGTVPRAVRRAMRVHGAHRIYVVQTEIAEDRLPCLAPPSPDSIACVNTHDMPTFASYCRGGDLDDLASLGFLDPETTAAEHDQRAAKLRVLTEFLRHGGWLAGRESDDEEVAASDLLRGCLRFLADSDAADVVVNLEDLWLEERPQNVPGTSHERPNWRRRARHTLDRMMSLPAVIETIDDVARRRARDRTTVS